MSSRRTFHKYFFEEAYNMKRKMLGKLALAAAISALVFSGCAGRIHSAACTRRRLFPGA